MNGAGKTEKREDWLGLFRSRYADRGLSALDSFYPLSPFHDVLERFQIIQLDEDDNVVLSSDGVSCLDSFDLRELSSDLPRFAFLYLDKDVDAYFHKPHRERIRTQN